MISIQNEFPLHISTLQSSYCPSLCASDTNAVQDLPVAYMPLGEKFPTDRADRIFKLVPDRDDDLVFRFDFSYIFYLIC